MYKRNPSKILSLCEEMVQKKIALDTETMQLSLESLLTSDQNENAIDLLMKLNDRPNNDKINIQSLWLSTIHSILQKHTYDP